MTERQYQPSDLNEVNSALWHAVGRCLLLSIPFCGAVSYVVVFDLMDPTHSMGATERFWSWAATVVAGIVFLVGVAEYRKAMRTVKEFTRQMQEITRRNKLWNGQ